MRSAGDAHGNLVTLTRLEIRHQAASSAEKFTCPSQWAEAWSSESPKSLSYRTIHLEVMPDSNAGLDGITMRGVLSICKAGLFTGGWYVEEGLDCRH